jgi:hypothetical protein
VPLGVEVEKRSASPRPGTLRADAAHGRRAARPREPRARAPRGPASAAARSSRNRPPSLPRAPTLSPGSRGTQAIGRSAAVTPPTGAWARLRLSIHEDTDRVPATPTVAVATELPRAAERGDAATPNMSHLGRRGGCRNPRNGVGTSFLRLPQPSERGGDLVFGVAATLGTGWGPRFRGCRNPQNEVGASFSRLPQPSERGGGLVLGVAATLELTCAGERGVAATLGTGWGPDMLGWCYPLWRTKRWSQAPRARALEVQRGPVHTREAQRLRWAHAPEGGVTAALRPIPWRLVTRVEATRARGGSARAVARGPSRGGRRAGGHASS